MVICSRLQLFLPVLRKTFLSHEQKIHFEFGFQLLFFNCDDDDDNTVSHKIFSVKFLFSFIFILELLKADSVVGNGWFQLTQFVLCSFHI